MPYRPNTPCSHPGCAALVPYGQKYCERHKALHPEEVRPSAKRGYGRKWQKVSQNYLQVDVPRRFYLSRKECLGILRKASAHGKELPGILKTALERQAERMEGEEGS